MKLRYTYTDDTTDHAVDYTIEEFVKAFNGGFISDLGYLEVIQ